MNKKMMVCNFIFIDLEWDQRSKKPSKKDPILEIGAARMNADSLAKMQKKKDKKKKMQKERRRLVRIEKYEDHEEREINGGTKNED